MHNHPGGDNVALKTRTVAALSPHSVRRGISVPTSVDGWLVECCFTSTETIGLLGTGAQIGHLDFHTAPDLCYLCVPLKSKSDDMVLSKPVTVVVLGPKLGSPPTAGVILC